MTDDERVEAVVAQADAAVSQVLAKVEVETRRTMEEEVRNSFHDIGMACVFEFLTSLESASDVADAINVAVKRANEGA